MREWHKPTRRFAFASLCAPGSPMAPVPPFVYDGPYVRFAFQMILIRHQDSVHERVMKISLGLPMFHRDIDRFEGAAQKHQ